MTNENPRLIFNDGKCYVCGKITLSISKNPSMWNVFLPHIDGKGKHRHYHVKCLYPILINRATPTLVPLDREKLYVFLKKISVGSWSLDNMAQLIADEFGHPASNLVPLDKGLLHKLSKKYIEIDDFDEGRFIDEICAKFGHPARKEININNIMDILNEYSVEPREQKLKISKAIKKYIDGKE